MQFASNDTSSSGTVVMTQEQTNGRGQRGNVWESNIGENLLFSLILRPKDLPPQNQFRLNWVISLGLQDYLIFKGLSNVFIKWPNDIYVDNNKICGILIENLIKGKFITTSILGIGLNITQSSFNSPKATSLKIIQKTDFDLEIELNQLLQHIENRYRLLLQDQLVILKKDYLSSLMWFNETHKFKKGETVFSGAIVNVDDYGRLLVKTKDGIEMFHFKEIEYVK